MVKLYYPFDGSYVITQTYAQHVARAQSMGCCSKPGTGCGCYYYGGIDYGCPTMTPIKAALAGTIKVAQSDATGYGTHVKILHDNGYLTVYGHLQNIAVSQGSRVETGQIIGYSDNTGNSTGQHLHFELRDPSGVPLDPQPFLDEETPPTPPNGNYPEFPELPQARALTELNVRLGPGTKYGRLYTLADGEEFGVMGVSEQGEEDWLQIGHREWCAIHYHGDTYVEFIE